VSRRKLQLFPIGGVLFLAALGLIVSGARAANFTASLDRDTIPLGESATLSLTFEGGQPGNVLIPQVTGLQIKQVGRSSQTTDDFSGHGSSTTTILFAVAPQQAGKFTIPSLTAEIDGRQFSTQPVSLTVFKADAPSAASVNSGSEITFMKLSLPRKNVYVGQMLPAQLQLCLRDDVQNFGNFQFTGQPANGFTIGNMVQSQNQHVQIGNRGYTVIPLTFALTAIKSGTLSLGPFTASAVVVLPSQNEGNDPFAQMGIRSPLYNGEQKQVSLATEVLEAESLPLPAENVPADFNGAVGDYKLSMTVGPTNVAVGDPITVRVQISGNGALDTLTLPAETAWKNFKTYPPTSKVEFTDKLGLEGTKTFEEIVTPQNTDVHELPQLSFSFFNPDDGRYHALTQPAVPLVVRSAGVTPMPTFALNKNSAAENQTPQDILPIKEKLGTLVQTNTPLIAQPEFLALQTVPLIAFFAAFVWRKRADNLANNPRLRRQRRVAQLVQTGLNDLRKFAAENNSGEFFALLFRLLQEQLGERLDCPASAITENVIDEHPVLRGAPKVTLDGLRELFQLCNQARYAPVRGAGELTAVVAQFEKTVSELQKLKA
jgi:hypothetical protein